jgi:DNA-binding NarL/FixJ family response regulator
MKAITVLVADDHKMMRDGLRMLLSQTKNIDVVGEAHDGQTAVQMAKKLYPDVIVMDIGMPGLNGIEATRQIVGKLPNTRVVALSMHADRRYVVQMLKAGASAYLHKDNAFDELAEAIQTVMKGKTYLSPDIARNVVEECKRLSGKKDDGTVFTILTDREREVLQQIAEGKATKEIASDLSVSVKTIETHRHQIMEKLNLHSVAELTKYAIREGLTVIER